VFLGVGTTWASIRASSRPPIRVSSSGRESPSTASRWAPGPLEREVRRLPRRRITSLCRGFMRHLDDGDSRFAKRSRRASAASDRGPANCSNVLFGAW